MTPLKTIEHLTPDQITLVASSECVMGRIRVREGAGFRWLLSGGSSVQSLMSLKAPTKLLMPNQIAMLFGLLLIDEVDTLLNLGMGGGSFERFFKQLYPKCSMTSVESNDDVIRFAREHFGLPSDLQVVTAFAEEFVQTSNGTYSLIFCDIFEQEKNPACVSDARFYQDIKSVLSSDGALVLNTVPESDEGLLILLQALRTSFTQVFLCPVTNHGNIIIVAKDGVVPSIDQLYERAQSLTQKVELPLCDWVNQFQLIPERTR